MKLSEAIRLGSLLKPQCEGALWKDGQSCALGAACDAVGVPDEEDYDIAIHALRMEYPALDAEAQCPACSFIAGIWRRWREKEYDVEDVIIHLNDDHLWKRERIAAWVALREPVEVAASVGAVVPVEAIVT